jgi:hypothetical protein
VIAGWPTLRVDMTSEVKRVDEKKLLHLRAPFFVLLHKHTRVDAEIEPVMPTVDPADIRGLGTTVL